MTSGHQNLGALTLPGRYPVGGCIHMFRWWNPFIPFMVIHDVGDLGYPITWESPPVLISWFEIHGFQWGYPQIESGTLSSQGPIFTVFYSLF